MDAMVRTLEEAEKTVGYGEALLSHHRSLIEGLQAEAGRVTILHEAKLDFLKLDPDALSDSADVAIAVQDGEQLHAHRLILSSRSSVFKLQFEKYGNVVKIEDTSLAVMGVVLKFCYTAEIKFTDEVSALEVIKFAHDYKIDHLHVKCMSQLMKTLNQDNVREILMLSRKYKARILEDAATQYMEQVGKAAAAA